MLVLLLLVALAQGLSNGDQTPALQPFVPSFLRCDGPSDERVAQLADISHRQGLPGVQIAHIDANGKIVSCASGWARYVPLPEPMSTEHRLRYASLSKIFTAAVTLRFVASGRLRLEDRLLDDLGIQSVPGDKRLEQITLVQLLDHTAGFDSALSGDSMMARDPWCPTRLHELDHAVLGHSPGTRFSYSNLGYCLLGAVLSRTGGQAIKDLYHDFLFDPLDVQDIKPASQQRFSADEPRYFFDSSESRDDLLSIDYESNLATGGWSGNALQMAKLVSAVYGPASIIPAALVAHALSIPETCDSTQWRHCHAIGVYRYHETGERPMFWRDGSLPGVTAFAAVFENGETIVLLGNRRDTDWKPLTDLLGKRIYQLFR